jgi:hypothetical protein
VLARPSAPRPPTVSMPPPPQSAPASQPRIRPVAEHFVSIAVAQKNIVTRALSQDRSVRRDDLHRAAAHHLGVSVYVAKNKKRTAQDMRNTLNAHQCVATCLVKREYAVKYLGRMPFPVLSQSDFLLSAKTLKLKIPSIKPVSTSTSTRKRKSSDQNIDSQAPPANRRRLDAQHAPNNSDRATSWPEILPWAEKVEIMKEYRQATGNKNIRRLECSFCGVLEPLKDVHLIPQENLDISLLESAVEMLRTTLKQEAISVFNPQSCIDNCYCVCKTCKVDISRSKFKSIPVRSYANGLWCGPVPEPLQGLTFLKEQCIARARATRCMFKLELGPSGQFSSRGNACIFAQDPSPLLTALPPPLSALRDEICVILVGSPNAEIQLTCFEKHRFLYDVQDFSNLCVG